MSLLRRRPRPSAPTDEDKALAREHGERAVAAAATTGGARVVATDVALHVTAPPADPAGLVRLPWDRVARATWDDEREVLVVVGSPGEGRPSRRLDLPLRAGEAARLLEVVRVSVTSSVVVSQRVESPEHGGAWLTARRSPRDGEVRWAVVFDPGLDPADPARRAWVDARLAEVRAGLGV